MNDYYNVLFHVDLTAPDLNKDYNFYESLITQFFVKSFLMTPAPSDLSIY